MERKLLFGEYKYCRNCSKALSDKYDDDICPECKAMDLFRNVKEYISMGNVTEHDVAKHFNIPLSLVRHWIREGRIEYSSDMNMKIQFGRLFVYAVGNQ